MNFDQLKYFRVVAEEENIYRASQQLHITQQGLSANIIKLEKELGVYLFDRVGRQIFLNDNGRTFLRYAQLLLQDYQAALDVLHGGGVGETQVLSIATTGKYLTSKLISGYLSCHDDVQIDLTMIEADEIAHTLSQSHAHFVVSSIRQEGPDIAARLLFEEPLMLLISKDDPLAEQEAVSLSELRELRFALPGPRDAFRKDFDAVCARTGFRPRIALTAGSNDSIVRAVSKRIGVSACGKYAYDDEALLSARGLRMVPIAEEFARRSIYLLWKKDRLQEEYLRKFRDYAVTNAAELVMNPML